MSLLDAFKPKWQNSNPVKRIEAVEELGSRNQDILENIALRDEDADVRTAAIKKLVIVDALLKVSKNDREAAIRRLAENRYYEEITKKLKDFREPATPEITAYLDELKDTRYADELLKSMKSSELRLALVQKCNKTSLLTYAANRDAKEEISKVALNRLESEPSIQDVIKNSKHTAIRKMAAEKLRAIRDAKDGGQKATALLFSKREALIQQAHHFAAKKNPIAIRPQFEALMAEAQALGMGPAQATLDNIYDSFIKFANEADAARIALEKAEQEKQENANRLSQSLDELESILDDGKVEEQAERITAIIEDWAQFKSIMNTVLIKRFNIACMRLDDLKKTVSEEEPIIAPAEGDDVRSILLERLQALADSNVGEMTEKHLRAIVRDWEKLPLLEGSDSVLQNYNTLRNKLSEMIFAFNESSQKIVEENSIKLRKLIENIKSIDENEEFKEINRKLRETFQEWKKIVGDQKFKYHDLWQEYKGATSRFQEMQQWESWHNENDRDSLLKEMEALANEQARLC